MSHEPHHYANTAYHSGKVSLQPPRVSKGILKKLMSVGQTILPFHHTDDSVPATLYREKTPSQWHQEHPPGSDEGTYWNEESLTVGTMNGWALVYLYISSIAKVMVVVFTPFMILCTILLNLLDGRWVERFHELLLPYFQYFFLPSLVLMIQFILCNNGHWSPWYFRWLMGMRKQFELNRRTGMVTLYKRGNKVRYSHPFVEFDCLLVSTPTHQGFLRYSLMLAHRYNGSKFGIPFHGFVGDNERVAEYHRLWNMIQRYMDTSQPLPDTLLLEASRDKDPTTQEYDLKQKRAGDYWRSMSDEEYQRVIDDIIRDQTWSKSPVGGQAISMFEQ